MVKCAAEVTEGGPEFAVVINMPSGICEEPPWTRMFADKIVICGEGGVHVE